MRHENAVLTTEDEISKFLETNKIAFYLIGKALVHHDQSDSKRRLLIYYEDLITDPIREVTKVLNFLGKPITDDLNPEYLKKFLMHQ